MTLRTWLHVALFSALAVGLSWIPTRLLAAGWDPLLQVVTVFSPALAAVIVRTLVAREGFRDAGLRLRGVGARWWLLAVALPLAWDVVYVAIEVARGRCTLHTDAFGGYGGWLLRTVPGALVFLSGEELGWRSYLQEKLRPLGLVASALPLGLVWWAWHPDVFFGPKTSVEHALEFLAYVLALTPIFGWLLVRSGSIWPCLVLHVVNNLPFPKGTLACADPSSVSLAEVLPRLATVVVLWRLGQLRRER